MFPAIAAWHPPLPTTGVWLCCAEHALQTVRKLFHQLAIQQVGSTPFYGESLPWCVWLHIPKSWFCLLLFSGQLLDHQYKRLLQCWDDLQSPDM